VKKNGGVTATYNYNTNGNRFSLMMPSGTTTGTSDAQDRLTQYSSTTYGYSANGELQSTTTSGQTTMYAYDVLGNLKSIVGPAAFTVEYVIDGQNRRIGKKVNGVLCPRLALSESAQPSRGVGWLRERRRSVRPWHQGERPRLHGQVWGDVPNWF